MMQDRRSFMRAVGASGIGVTATGLISERAAAATIITVKGDGYNIWSDRDAFHYFYQPVSGDFDVTIRNLFVEDTDSAAFGGIMVRESLDPSSKNLVLRRFPSGDVSAQWRSEDGGGTSGQPGSVPADWMRLKREDNTLTAYGSQGEPTSEDDWTVVGTFGTDTIELSDDTFLGLAVTSHDAEQLCTTRWTELSESLSVSEMTSADIGDPQISGNVSVSEGIPLVTTQEATDVEGTSATLNGHLEDLGSAESADVYFEYHETGADTWETTTPETRTSPGSFSQMVSELSISQQSYEFRAVVNTNDGDSNVGLTRSFETPSVASVESITDLTHESATLVGAVDLDDPTTVEAHFEYRKVPTESWTATEAQTPSGDGSISQSVSGLTGRRYYQVRLIAESSDESVTSLVNLFDTPNPSSGDGSGGDVESASYFDLDDGFADPAPWLDDQTPVVTITEPTRGQLKRADVDGERLIVFETSGVVDLGYSSLAIENDKCWIAGQTAPSPGFIFIKGTIQLSANDCVIQHIGSYRGKQEGAGEGKDALTTADETTNNVIDHVSAFWGRDENLSVGYRTEDTTVTNCLSAEGLVEPAENSNGSLIGDDSTNVALIGNIWAKNVDRNPRLKSGTESVVVNNVMYYFDDAVQLDESTVSSVVGNGFLDTIQPSDPAIHHGRFYVEDNYADPEIDPLYEADELLSEPPLWPEGLKALPSEEVLDHNLKNVGSRPADRIEHDRRVLQDVREGTGDFVASQDDVGGYPDLQTNSRPVNVPRSGVRHWLTVQAMQVEQPAMDYYQVDFVAGDPIEDLRADALYAEENSLMRFAHGSVEEGITEKDTAWPSAEIRECVEYGHINETDDGTAEVDISVADGCERTLSLVVYRKPDASFSLETVDEQLLVHSTTETYGPGDHTIEVDLPTED